MSIQKVNVYMRPESEKCQELINFASKENLPLSVVDITTEEGHNLSKKHEVLRLPTAVILDESDNIVERLYTIEEFKKFFKLK